MKLFKTLILLICCIFGHLTGSAVDYSYLPYSGKVSVDGINFNGTAKFTFSISKNGLIHWKSSASIPPKSKCQMDNTAFLGGQGSRLSHRSFSTQTRALP